MNIVWYLSIVVKSEAVSNIKDGSFEKNSHTFYQYFIKSTNADTDTDIAFLTDANISVLVKSIGLSMLTSSFSLLEFYVEGPKGETPVSIPGLFETHEIFVIMSNLYCKKGSILILIVIGIDWG